MLCIAPTCPNSPILIRPFPRSFVMSERVVSSGAEMKELRERVSTLEAERSSMQDDVLQLRDAKHIIDKTCQVRLACWTGTCFIA